MIPRRLVFAPQVLAVALAALSFTPAVAQPDPAYYVDISACMEEARPARKAACYAELETLLRELRSGRAEVPPVPPAPAVPPTPPVPGTAVALPGLGRAEAGWRVGEQLGLWVQAPGGRAVFVILEAGR